MLGTPIVGDYKYGWQAHRKRNWEQVPSSNVDDVGKKSFLPFRLEVESGSICDKQPRLHLHCKQIHLPDVSAILEHHQASGYDLSELESLDLVAPLPPYMRKSLDSLK